MSEAIIGPQPCVICGGGYGYHRDNCSALADQSHAPASANWVSRREHEQEVARLKAQIAELERQLAWFLKNEKIPE